MPAVPNSYANCNAVSSGMTEAALAGTTSSLSTPLLLLGLFNVLYLLGPPIFSWRFPCQSTDELDLFMGKLEEIIENNSSLERDVLGEYAEEFKASLEILSNEAYEIKILSYREPGRTNPYVWVKFQWSLLRDVNACYTSLKRLKGEIEAKIREGQKAD